MSPANGAPRPPASLPARVPAAAAPRAWAPTGAHGAVRPPASPGAPAPSAAPAAKAPRIGFPQRLVYLLWVFALFEPHKLLQHYGPDAAGKIPFLFYGILLVVFVAKPPRRGWFVPFGLLALYTVVMSFAAVNHGEARAGFKVLFLYWLLAVGTINYIRTMREARPILAMMFGWQALWWQVNGLRFGLVPWHGDLGNYDSFGPLSAICLGLGIYYGFGATNRKDRWIGLGGALLSVGGVVASFARGAVLAAGLVMVVVWLRSPRKGRMTMAMAGALVVVLIMSAVTSDDARGGDPDSPKGFINEMMTMFDDNGSSDNGSDREELWKAAIIVFKAHPILGVGANNFGPTAAGMIQPGQLGGNYQYNPQVLYQRALHSSYYQVLCEYGILGASIFVWLLIDFVRRNRRLRSPPYVAAWKAISDNRFDLPHLSLGLEAGFLGFLGSALFYNQLWLPWLYSILTCNLLLDTLASRGVETLTRTSSPAPTGAPPKPRQWTARPALPAHLTARLPAARPTSPPAPRA